jgi:hypothetical protein
MIPKSAKRFSDKIMREGWSMISKVVMLNDQSSGVARLWG